MWSLGGFGVWWPSRVLAEHPLIAIELSFSHQKDPSDGSVSLFGCLKGQRASSTRAEIMAGIIGAAGPGAIHQATDSMSYCKEVFVSRAGSHGGFRKMETCGKSWRSLCAKRVRML